MNNTDFYLILLTIVVGVAVITSEDFIDVRAEKQYYCEMIQIHEASNGQYGWPNYKKVDCDDH